MYIYFKSAEWLYCYFNSSEPISYENQNIVISRAEELIKEYLENAESIDEIIKFRKKMNDEEFIEKLEMIACFDICMYDISRTLKRNGTNFDNIYEKVPTTTIYDLTIFANNNFEYEYLHNYSIDEIKKLVDNGDIIIVEEYMTSLFKLGLESKNRNEKCKTFNPILKSVKGDTYDDRECLDDYFTKNDDFYYKVFINYVRSQVKTSWLKKELEKYINEISLGVETMQEQSNNKIESVERREVIKSCLDNFEEKGYVKRLEKLKENYN